MSAVKIPLYSIKYKNKFAIIDEDDFSLVDCFLWYYQKSKRNEYARAQIKHEGKWRQFKLHQFIMGHDIDGMIDHINGNGLDNRKANLRVCSNSQNIRNSRKRNSVSTSTYKGVSFRKERNSWIAVISYDRKRVYLGSYKTQEEAALAYNNAAAIYHKEFARMNVINPVAHKMAHYLTKNIKNGTNSSNKKAKNQ